MENDKYMINPHLEGDDFFWKGNPTGILLIHGFTATTTEVRLIGEKLRDDRFTVAAPLLPGHGTHPDDLNRASWQMWLGKVKEFYENLARECEQVFVLGHSMGGLLALELGAQHPEIKGLLLSAPAIEVKGVWLSHILKPFKDYWEKSNNGRNLPWKGYNVYPIKAISELHKLQHDVKKQLSKINQPTLIFSAEFDTHSPPETMAIIFNNIRSNHKCHIHLENSPHTILLANEVDLAYEYILKFIKDQSYYNSKVPANFSK
jgi:carboxylesterase